MSSDFALIGLATVLLLGAMSPGPSFILVARMAVAQSRAHGLAAALGMGIGGGIFALAALIGLQSLLAAVPALYVGVKLFGGAYLIYLGVMIWRGAKQPLPTAEAGAARGSIGRAFLVALGTQLSNPKTAIAYTGIFAAFLPEQASASTGATVLALVLIIETSWYTLVALLLSAPAPRAVYLRGKAWIDRGVGTAMGLLGMKLLVSARD
ncbi:threonine transporter [Elstera litoralis]|uniref:Threonine transporter n=1 Tax=Elstera litoralis TaxID=552518 RepID=A0A0F3IPE0_9PROT|nr:LysE family translocator [Elstera litoralis]KJV08423.1 threonine transporter [Elstera litoralis]